MTDLDPLGPYSVAEAINNQGAIVGGITNASDNQQSAALLDHGTVISLDGNSYAFDINNTGEVVGVSNIDGSWASWVWGKGVTTYLPAPVGGSSSGSAINNSGQIAGSIADPGEPGHAVIFTRG